MLSNFNYNKYNLCQKKIDFYFKDEIKNLRDNKKKVSQEKKNSSIKGSFNEEN